MTSFSYSLNSYFSLAPLDLFRSTAQEKNSPKTFFEGCKDLEGLSSKLTAQNSSLDQWIQFKNEIKTFILDQSQKINSNGESLDQCFQVLSKWGIEQDPQKTMLFFQDLLDENLIKKAISSRKGVKFNNLFDLADCNAKECYNPPDSSIGGRIYSEWNRIFPVVFYFIPSILNIFFDALAYLDSSQKFTSLWEKYLILEIFYKCFLIPHYLIVLLTPLLIVPAKVYFAAILVIGLTGTLLNIYQRYLKPLPNEIVYGKNLDNCMKNGLIKHSVGQSSLIKKLYDKLNEDKPIILTGLSGEGKTSLIHHFVQLKNERNLPKKLMKYTVFQIDSGALISSRSFGYTDVINYIKNQIHGFEDQALLYFDNFEEIAFKPEALAAFKTNFLGAQPSCKCVMAITEEHLKKVKIQDVDDSLKRRVVELKLSTPKNLEIRRIAQNYVFHEAQDVYITSDAIECAISKSAGSNYFPLIGRASKIEQILSAAVGKCRTTLNDQQNERKLSNLKKYLGVRKKINDEYSRLSHLFVKINQKKSKNEPSFSVNTPFSKERGLYLWSCFYGKKAIEEILKEAIKEALTKQSNLSSIQVDKALIETVFTESV